MKLIDPRLLQQARSSRVALGLTIALGFAGGVLTVWQARTLSGVIAGVFLGGQNFIETVPALMLLLGIFWLRAGSLWGSEISANRVALRVKTGLREKLFAKIVALGPLYARGERTGELVNTATQGVEAMDAYFSQYLPQLVLAALLPLTYLCFVFPLDTLSGFVLLLTAPLIPVFMLLIGNLADALTKKQWRTLSRMSAHFLDVLQGLTTLKIYGRSRAQISVIRQVSERFRERTMGVLRAAFLSALVLEMVATISTAVVAVEIGLRLLYGKMDFPEALFVLLLAPEFYLPLRLLGTRFHAGVAGVTAAARIFEVLELPDRPKTDDGRRGQSVLGLRSSVRFSDVSYTYPDGRTALQNVSFIIEPGQKVALVGPSGAGKSTIAALLLGWMEPSEGAITLPSLGGRGGANKVRIGGGGIAWVPQTPYFFNDTIAANLRLAKPDSTPDEIVAAAHAAHAHKFILEMGHGFSRMDTDKSKQNISAYPRLPALSCVEVSAVQSLPPGYETLIAERGARLSGGQAQRIALARAFLMDAPFVILDEPIANLDPELETQLQESLDQLLADRTALIIAHRLNTVRNADKILVLNEGRVVQQGTHAELITQDGLYKDLLKVERPHVDMSTRPNALTSQRPDALTYPRTDAPTCQRTDVPTLLRLLAFLKPLKSWVALSALLGFATIASSIGLLGASAYIISAAALQPSIAELQVAIVGVRFFGIARGGFRYLERYVSHQTTFRVLARLRVWFYEKLEPLAPARLMQYRSGDLLTRIVADIESLENFYVRVVAPPLTAILVALLAAGLLWGFDPRLAAALLLSLLLTGAGVPLLTRWLSRDSGMALLDARTRLSVALVDGIQGLADLLAFGRSADYLERIQSLSAAQAQIQRRMAWISGLQTALMSLFTNLGMWLVLLIAIPLVISGQFNGVYLAVIALIALSSFEAVQPLPVAAQHLSENLEAAQRLFEIVDTKLEVATPKLPQAMPDEFAISVKNLSFQYPVFSDPSSIAVSPFCILHSSFTIPTGKRLAIVGPSGAGKTTLLDLLLRFWEFHEGEINLGGVDIRRLDPEDVRRQMTVVSQRTHLFNASVRENLLIANSKASPQAIIQAAQQAEIHEFIESLPEGYETFIGEQGLRLSGGERQRIAIARALLKNVPILLLDEPTANLDPITERAVMENIHALMAGRSTLLVTHRLVGMAWMDEILVMRKGEIVERGSHTELIATGGLYRRMWDLQNQVLDIGSP
jgi:ATP-binding cassette subfamily C protein CydCD